MPQLLAAITDCHYVKSQFGFRKLLLPIFNSNLFYLHCIKDTEKTRSKNITKNPKIFKEIRIHIMTIYLSFKH